MASSHPSSWILAVLLTSTVAACGGNFVGTDGETDSNPGDSGSDESGDDGAGGAATGGTASGGAGTGGASTGGSPSGAGGAECCLAFPSCDGFDKQIDSPADCPVGIDCYSSSICCSTIWCMPEQPACDGIAVCLEDETEVEECPPGGTCTVRSHCDSVIVCQLNEGVCDPEREHDRHYVAESTETCAVIDYACPEDTTGFSNECGCGCEQPAECPEFVNCEPRLDPGYEPDPLCSSEDCPYTVRAQ